MAITHKQVDFSGGLNYLADPAKIKPDEYYFLSNARIRDGGIIPVKLPLKIVLGLPSPIVVDIGVTDPQTGAPPPPEVTEVPPNPPPYPAEPTGWPPVPPFPVGSPWPPVTETMEDPPDYPPRVLPTLPSCDSQRTYDGTSRPWMPAGMTGPLKAPATITQTDNPNNILSPAVLTWWESKLVADFASWAVANGVQYDAYDTYWVWDTGTSGIDALALHGSGTYQPQPEPGWVMKIEYCEKVSGPGLFVSINYYNTSSQCNDSLLSGSVNNATEFPPDPVVFNKEQGPVLNPSIAPQTTHRVFLIRFDAAFLTHGVGEMGQAYTFTARHYTYNLETEACDLGTNWPFTKTYDDVVSLINTAPGSGTLADPYRITHNVS
jgi:hypothetical protein